MMRYPLTVRDFLTHHRDTVASIEVAMMNDEEYRSAIQRTAWSMPNARPERVYDAAMLTLMTEPQPKEAQYINLSGLKVERSE